MVYNDGRPLLKWMISGVKNPILGNIHHLGKKYLWLQPTSGRRVETSQNERRSYGCNEGEVEVMDV